MLKPDFARLLDEADIAALETVADRAMRSIGPRRDIIREGDAPRGLALLADGWGCRYKALQDGRRQILSFLLPGDLVSLGWASEDETDHSVASITPVRIAQIAREDMALLLANSRIRRLLGDAAVDETRMQREWLLSLGQRSAYERIAHLLCETFVRAAESGLARGDSVDFPLTQVDLADATGLTPVHVNRTLRTLRRDGLIEIHSRTLIVPDLPALRGAGAFSDTYLPM